MIVPGNKDYNYDEDDYDDYNESECDDEGGYDDVYNDDDDYYYGCITLARTKGNSTDVTDLFWSIIVPGNKDHNYDEDDYDDCNENEYDDEGGYDYVYNDEDDYNDHNYDCASLARTRGNSTHLFWSIIGPDDDDD